MPRAREPWHLRIFDVDGSRLIVGCHRLRQHARGRPGGGPGDHRLDPDLEVSRTGARNLGPEASRASLFQRFRRGRYLDCRTTFPTNVMRGSDGGSRPGSRRGGAAWRPGGIRRPGPFHGRPALRARVWDPPRRRPNRGRPPGRAGDRLARPAWAPRTGSVDAWINRVVTNVCISHATRERRRRSTFACCRSTGRPHPTTCSGSVSVTSWSVASAG